MINCGRRRGDDPGCTHTRDAQASPGYSHRRTYKTITRWGGGRRGHEAAAACYTAHARIIIIIKKSRMEIINIKRKTYRICSRARRGCIFCASVWASVRGGACACAGEQRESEGERGEREREGDFIVMHRTTCPLLKKRRESAAMLCRGYSVALIGSTSLAATGVSA